MKKILILCSTNVVRSPFFKVLLSVKALEGGYPYEFTSRGTLCGTTPRGADRRMEKLAVERGVTLASHVVTPMTLADLTEAALVVCCDEDSYWSVRRDYPSIPHPKVRMITEFGQDLGLKEIAEPVTGENSFEAVAGAADVLVPLILGKLQRYV